MIDPGMFVMIDISLALYVHPLGPTKLLLNVPHRLDQKEEKSEKEGHSIPSILLPLLLTIVLAKKEN